MDNKTSDTANPLFTLSAHTSSVQHQPSTFYVHQPVSSNGLHSHSQSARPIATAISLWNLPPLDSTSTSTDPILQKPIFPQNHQPSWVSEFSAPPNSQQQFTSDHPSIEDAVEQYWNANYQPGVWDWEKAFSSNDALALPANNPNMAISALRRIRMVSTHLKFDKLID
ncbi:hypothetical protein BATDEDRAFT_85880 [Batrachochytrium dendrobatidis JAM81]|uniref:Uncharacterized protein n=2 Tax=Batrachochytrium dendrobatidis TaxID=109871 RepID=F4NS04_BATDJ|nr:uncharacterized protein BATDEDRAFT_85880 [Batrachochytrium dendrobatidis JAM81]EGF83380.1 hypothetical protein BATDEDRAFT_85880 [Batrachochytrium dendrobatidis JAM81]KAJ8326809.1 hypothetical protein O5D80_004251 [Batrachochytrium dendrobatidis]KAK5668392.1 hypothetical protein QVD99_005414 [Batrachochytrium dendrobatidis]OAJ36868.1 hypothetical protein BDEG_20980 [Batrachochytrium dendrobatidis JEL423]|eukprot:XP_006676083.1 hypothetical protein BATDEDRAFT_85880 [Batrachochytrium dendrobatidis JAM81]